MQGYGYMMMEEMVYDKKGEIITNNLSTYKIPTAADVPRATRVQCYIVEVLDLFSLQIFNLSSGMLAPSLSQCSLVKVLVNLLSLWQLQ